MNFILEWTGALTFEFLCVWQADDCLADLRRALWEKEREWHLLISEERAGVDVDGAGAGGEEADASGTICMHVCMYIIHMNIIHTYVHLFRPRHVFTS
jgi:hypothetical protein